MDKSYAELKAIADVFPNARPTLCIFHVIQAVRRQLAKDEYGELSADMREEVVQLFKKILYAGSHEVLLRLEYALRDLCPQFWRYYVVHRQKHEP